MNFPTFTLKQSIDTGLYNAYGLCFSPKMNQILVSSWQESRLKSYCADSGKSIVWKLWGFIPPFHLV